MRKLAFFVFLLFISAALFGQLGLRTLTPSATESAVSTETQQVPGLKLRTVDPLLLSFREGWKSPEDPNWTTEKVGDKSIKLPKDFSISLEKLGVNYDAQILDAKGRLFGRLFYYQLESYDLEELFRDVVYSVYGNSDEVTKSYEDKKDFDNGLTVYLASVKMPDKPVEFPAVFVYTREKDSEMTKPGPVAMFFFEPVNFSGAELDTAKEQIAGIVGSYLQQTKASVKKEDDKEDDVVTPPAKRIESSADPYISVVRDTLYGEEIEINMDDWIEVGGDYFGFMMPPEFSVEFTMGEDFEVADLGYDGIIVGKFLVGEIYDTVWAIDILYEVIDEYLSSFGDYDILESYSEMVDEDASINIYTLEFPGQKCWITLFSESEDSSMFGPGEFFVFIGLYEEAQKTTWANWYSGMLFTLDF